MKLKLLFTEDTARPVAVAVADTGEPIDGVVRLDMDIRDGTLTVVLDLDRVKLDYIKTVR